MHKQSAGIIWVGWFDFVNPCFCGFFQPKLGVTFLSAWRLVVSPGNHCCCTLTGWEWRRIAPGDVAGGTTGRINFGCWAWGRRVLVFFFQQKKEGLKTPTPYHQSKTRVLLCQLILVWKNQWDSEFHSWGIERCVFSAMCLCLFRKDVMCRWMNNTLVTRNSSCLLQDRIRNPQDHLYKRIHWNRGHLHESMPFSLNLQYPEVFTNMPKSDTFLPTIIFKTWRYVNMGCLEGGTRFFMRLSWDRI